MKIIKNITILINIIFLFSCGEDKLTPVEYIRWVENPENGLKMEKQEDKYKFLLQYQPVEYNIINELRQPEIEEEILNKKRLEKEGLQYFIFKITNAENQPVFSGNGNVPDSILNYLNYQMQQDFYVVEQGDTLPCNLYHYENTNGITPYDSFILGFNANTDSLQNKTFLFKAGVINLDWITFNISKTAIQNIPAIKTLQKI